MFGKAEKQNGSY
ncbi:hypothetical protein SAMN05660816_05250 [Niastella yeongjuensis]|nr:hypothetical protein SAMN05660816_05250 [Niastella yeongjuensis]